MYFQRAVVIVLFIVLYSGSSTPFVSLPYEENSKDSPSSQTSLEPPVPRFKCAALPAVSDVFEQLIKKECYVDKTDYLFKMVNENETQVLWFLSRPRRFGKTLLVDTMESYFKGEKKLFEGTEIYQHYLDNDWPKYPVIRLDFSSGISVDSFAEFKTDLLQKLRRIGKSHDIHLDAASVPSALEELIESLHTNYHKKVIVLIDEYEAPYTGMYMTNKVEASRVLRTLQSFFKTLKGAVKIVHFSFTTGITRLALSDFFSGANAAVDLTMDPEYAEILGFTDTELREYFGGFIENVASGRGNTTKSVLDEMKQWYDGFRFTMKNEPLYNPISVIGYLRSKGEKKASFSATVDDSSFFINRFKQFPKQALEVFLNDGINNQSDVSNERKITAKEIELTGKINFENSESSVALTALLFHSGYLRIKSFNNRTESYSLEFTNQELKENYAKNLYYSFSDTLLSDTDLENQVNSLIQDLDASRWTSFISKLNSLHSRVPYFLLDNAKKQPEALFQVSMYWIFHFSKYGGLGKPTMEDATNFGRSDILLPLKNKMYIFELNILANPESPLYECKVKYIQKHLYSKTEEIVCIGLRFDPKGVIGDDSWGVAKFLKEAILIEEAGSITLTNQLSTQEKQKIKNILTDFEDKHSNFTLQPDKLTEFLTDIGPTRDDERSFANHFTTDIKLLCTLLRKIKKELQSNLKSIIQGFLNRFDPEKRETTENLRKKKKILSCKN